MAEFVARQPIFNQTEHVYGYEILFRSSLENLFESRDGETASRVVADHLLSLGQTLTEERLAFINCTADFLTQDFVLVLPPEKTVVEVLETVVAGREVLDACKRLKKARYLIALDDFVLSRETEPLIEFADFIKVDFLKTTPSERKTLSKKFGAMGIGMLAEKVETMMPIIYLDSLNWAHLVFKVSSAARRC